MGHREWLDDCSAAVYPAVCFDVTGGLLELHIAAETQDLLDEAIGEFLNYGVLFPTQQIRYHPRSTNYF